MVFSLAGASRLRECPVCGDNPRPGGDAFHSKEVVALRAISHHVHFRELLVLTIPVVTQIQNKDRRICGCAKLDLEHQ